VCARARADGSCTLGSAGRDDRGASAVQDPADGEESVKAHMAELNEKMVNAFRQLTE